MKKFWKWILKVLGIKDDEPSQETETWTNESSGFQIRLKNYKTSPGGMHQGRKTSIKIDTRFHTEYEMTGDNTKVKVDDGELVYYGIDAENGKHDLCFADMNKFQEDHNAPAYIKIYKDEKLHTVCKIDRWEYRTVYVQDTIDDIPVKWKEW